MIPPRGPFISRPVWVRRYIYLYGIFQNLKCRSNIETLSVYALVFKSCRNIFPTELCCDQIGNIRQNSFIVYIAMADLRTVRC